MSALVGCSGDKASAPAPRQEEPPQYYRLQSVELPWLDEFGNTLATSTTNYIYSNEHELVRIEAQSLNSLQSDDFPDPEGQRGDPVFQEQFVDETAGAWIVELGVSYPGTEEYYPRETQHWQDFELQYTMANLHGWQDGVMDESGWVPWSDAGTNTAIDVQLPTVSSQKSFGDSGELLAKTVILQTVIHDEPQLQQTLVTYEYSARGLPDTIVSVTYSGSSESELTPTGEREELVFHYPPDWSETVEVTVERRRYRDDELVEHQEQTGRYARQPCGERLAARARIKTPDPLPWCLAVDRAVP